MVECPAEIGVMRADVTKLRQTLFIPSSNASKFTDKGLIKLEVRCSEVRSQKSRLWHRTADL